MPSDRDPPPLPPARPARTCPPVARRTPCCYKMCVAEAFDRKQLEAALQKHQAGCTYQAFPEVGAGGG